MTERKSRKQNRPDECPTAAKRGRPGDRAGQAPATSPVVVSPDEGSGQSDQPGQTMETVARSDDDGSWINPFPGGLNEQPQLSVFADDMTVYQQGLPDESASIVAPPAFPGWSSSWQAASTGAILLVAFPGGNNPPPDRLPEDRDDAPFPGGLNPANQDKPVSASPADLPDRTAETRSADANSEAQTPEALLSRPRPSTSAGNQAKKSKRKKK